jgi:hypothetical protein
MSLPAASAAALDMPALYFELTTREERERHRAKIERLPSPRELLIEAESDGAGGWLAEMVTTDWDEPGLLDRVFEAILNCVHVPGGLDIHRIRVFTGQRGQVVNVLEFRARGGGPFSRASCDHVIEELRRIRPGERAVLETISSVKSSRLIPTLTEFPAIDNAASDRFTHLLFTLPRLSTRFTSILLHTLARSEFRVNVQLAEFRQARQGQYSLFVLDKWGRQVSDTAFLRHSLIRALEAMNRLILRFNLVSIRRSWQLRIERNDGTIYRSRPDPADVLDDLEAIRQLARLKGVGDDLRALAESGLLASADRAALESLEAFCRANEGRFRALAEAGPTEADVALCREYFELRRHSLRVLQPLYGQLTRLEPIRPAEADRRRLEALARPWPGEAFALDEEYRLYAPRPKSERGPGDALAPFLLSARTGCPPRDELLAATEAALEFWTPEFLAVHRHELGPGFLSILEEGLRQGTAAPVLRQMRQVGLLQRLLPGFARVTGMIHSVSDHRYTVDEHSILLVEALTGMTLLADVLPRPGAAQLRSDYEKLTTAVGLSLYARKYAAEERMLRAIPQIRSHPAIKPFFQLLDEVRDNSLEYVAELNLLEYSRATGLTALRQIDEIRRQMGTLLRHHVGLGFEVRRDMALAALLHDMDKPDVDHGRTFGPKVARCLEDAGIGLPAESMRRVAWLVTHHLDLAELLNRIGSEGEQALIDYLGREAAPDELRMLIVFTHADRVAVHQDPNVTSHNSLVLTDLMREVDRLESEGKLRRAG